MDTIAIIGAIAAAVALIIRTLSPLLIALARLESTTEATHVLLNSSMRDQLRLTAKAMRRIASLTPHDPTAEADAVIAEGLLADHDRRQARLDAAGSTLGPPSR